MCHCPAMEIIKYSKEWWREYRIKRGESLRVYNRKRDAGRYEKNPDAERIRRTRWNRDNPERAAAHSAVAHAVLFGKIEKLPCQVCGAPEEQSYAFIKNLANRLDVEWLCPVHHAKKRREQ